VCPCRGPGEAKSFAALDLGQDAVAPELAYVTARHALTCIEDAALFRLFWL
jgi:hypothetical protein